MFTAKKKERIVAELRARMNVYYAGEHVEAACLRWAGLVCAHLTGRYRLRTILQAGTMEWPCVAVDDGLSPTHFGYVWEPESAVTREMLARGLMPEMHVWAAIPAYNEIVDVTTRYLVHQAQHRASMKWSALLPPDFLWSRPEALPAGVIYRPDYQATIWAARALGHLPRRVQGSNQL